MFKCQIMHIYISKTWKITILVKGVLQCLAINSKSPLVAQTSRDRSLTLKRNTLRGCEQSIRAALLPKHQLERTAQSLPCNNTYIMHTRYYCYALFFVSVCQCDALWSCPRIWKIVCAILHSIIHSFIHSRPDITVMVEWALKINNLFIHSFIHSFN